MKAVQILMDERLLGALDRSAKRTRRDRSKLVREAIASYLAAEEAREKDRRLIDAYKKQPLTREELDWLGAGEWPKD
ncbi:MAG: CopG family ribbon-helix-helix protein [Myxococcota bacterium]